MARVSAARMAGRWCVVVGVRVVCVVAGVGALTCAGPAAQAEGAVTARGVAAGAGLGCALLSGSHVNCWGEDYYGELGNDTEGEFSYSSTPVEVLGISDATQVTAGATFACALLSTDRVDCWGANKYGELGTGKTKKALSPVEVLGISDATQVTAGGVLTCALLFTGHLDCWGDNKYGELGNGTTTTSHTAVEVEGISDATQVKTGYDYACALLSTGHLDCWGYNGYGELGNGTTSNSDTAVEVEGISDATQVTAGYNNHACALVSGGQIDCWGENKHGELGNGTTSNSDTPVAVEGISDATQVSAGEYDTCALLSTGQIDCWGDNEHGELGNGTTTNSDTPVEVQGISDVTQVAAGEGETCALLFGGQVDCWGDNDYGQLGDGTFESSDSPVEALLGLAPEAVTGSASSVTEDSATLNATVNPEGGDVTSCEFEYGRTKKYGSSVPCSSLPGSGESAVEVSASVSGLSAHKAYHFRIVVTNAHGTSYGADAKLKTAKA